MGLLKKETNGMKYLKWIWELINELSWGLTQNGRVKILPEENENETF